MTRTIIGISGILATITGVWCWLDKEYIPAALWGIASVSILIASRSFDLPGRD